MKINVSVGTSVKLQQNVWYDIMTHYDTLVFVISADVHAIHDGMTHSLQ